jgi:hypothetical protein
LYLRSLWCLLERKGRERGRERKKRKKEKKEKKRKKRKERKERKERKQSKERKEEEFVEKKSNMISFMSAFLRLKHIDLPEI